MSEKRFVQCEIEYGFVNTTNIKKIDGIYDMQEEKTYRIEQISDLLNEQQSTITKLEIELTDCKNRKEQSEYNLHKKIRELENKFEKIPPKIRELWVE